MLTAFHISRKKGANFATWIPKKWESVFDFKVCLRLNFLTYFTVRLLLLSSPSKIKGSSSSSHIPSSVAELFSRKLKFPSSLRYGQPCTKTFFRMSFRRALTWNVSIVFSLRPDFQTFWFSGNFFHLLMPNSQSWKPAGTNKWFRQDYFDFGKPVTLRKAVNSLAFICCSLIQRWFQRKYHNHQTILWKAWV